MLAGTRSSRNRRRRFELTARVLALGVLRAIDVSFRELRFA